MSDQRRMRSNNYYAANYNRLPSRRSWKLTKRGETIVGILFFIALFAVMGFCGYIETLGMTP